eukprot:1614007-Prymnesium_polylepis.1
MRRACQWPIASSSGVSPTTLRIRASAWALSRRQQTSAKPPLAAKWRGVLAISSAAKKTLHFSWLRN